MFRSLSTAAIALTASVLLAAAPAKAQAQYVVPQQTAVGLSIASPNFSLGIGTPVYRPVPVAPYYPVAPVYVPRPVYPAPYVTPYRPWGYGGYGSPYHHHNHYGPYRW